MAYPWRFHSYFNAIKLVSLTIQVGFNRIGRSAYEVADSLAKG